MIIAAAVREVDYKGMRHYHVHALPAPARHGDCLELMGTTLEKTGLCSEEEIRERCQNAAQGFIDDNWGFVDREWAFRIVKQQGQKTTHELPEYDPDNPVILVSEDLW